ncbi:hypothetical protein [Nonomuraea sp. NPDC046570]|uniref:hypothetical protein n=1 Tax=Nonomuraea sp. NPDC046570 TaxID=3155255 RepID=UPI003400E1FA
MSLLNTLAQTQATLRIRRDVYSARTAFSVLENAAEILETIAPPHEFVTWAFAGQAASDGSGSLQFLTAHDPISDITGAPIDIDTAAQAMAALSSLLSQVLTDKAQHEKDPGVLLALLTAARHSSQIFLLASDR